MRFVKVKLIESYGFAPKFHFCQGSSDIKKIFVFTDWPPETSSGDNGEVPPGISDLLWAAINKP